MMNFSIYINRKNSIHIIQSISNNYLIIQYYNIDSMIDITYLDSII